MPVGTSVGLSVTTPNLLRHLEQFRRNGDFLIFKMSAVRHLGLLGIIQKDYLWSLLF